MVSLIHKEPSSSEPPLLCGRGVRPQGADVPGPRQLAAIPANTCYVWKFGERGWEVPVTSPLAPHCTTLPFFKDIDGPIHSSLYPLTATKTFHPRAPCAVFIKNTLVPKGKTLALISVFMHIIERRRGKKVGIKQGKKSSYVLFHCNCVFLAFTLTFIENEQIARKSILNSRWRNDCLQSHLKI